MLPGVQKTQQPTIDGSGKGDGRPGKKESRQRLVKVGGRGRRPATKVSTIGNESGGRRRGQWRQERWQQQKGWWASNGNSDSNKESYGKGGKGGRQRGLCPGRRERW